MSRIAATVGDPTSIGPEVADKALSSFLKKHKDIEVSLFGWAPLKHDRLHILDEEPAFEFGRPSKASGKKALENLRAATDFCLKNPGTPLVTGPVDKNICAKTDKGFSGQTGFLQKVTKASHTTMVLKGDSFSVALVTTHLPLKKVARALTKDRLQQTVELYAAYLKETITDPKIAVLGLNPHASDGGLMGSEEKEIITPTIKKLRRRLKNLSGPHPSDTFFVKVADYDGVVAMYHDQGLIPLKMKHFYDAVNISLGLPFLRVSVDHGTAFDIAGKNAASPLSYERALENAYQWSQKKNC